MLAFEEALKKCGKEIGRVADPHQPGIYHIKYQIKKMHRGKYIDDFHPANTKTVYDPRLFTYEKWQRSAEETVQLALESNNGKYPTGRNRDFSVTITNGNVIEGYLTDGIPPKISTSWLKPTTAVNNALNSITP